VPPYEPVGWQPSRSRATRFFPTLAVVALVIAVGIIGLQDKGTVTPSAAPLPPSPLVGVVIGVDSAGLADVRGFVLRLTDGATVTLKLGPLENATEFSPSHLSEHEATSEPIRAFYRLDETGTPVVYRLEDAST
jgi:hypothetical protein